MPPLLTSDVTSTQTVLMFTNSRMPYSRQLAAVAGVLDAAEGQARVGLHDAVDEDRAGLDLGGERARRARGRAVQSAAPRPKRESLASAIASSSSLARITAATGPKVSSSKAGMPVPTPASTVGG